MCKLSCRLDYCISNVNTIYAKINYLSLLFIYFIFGNYSCPKNIQATTDSSNLCLSKKNVTKTYIFQKNVLQAVYGILKYF